MSRHAPRLTALIASLAIFGLLCLPAVEADEARPKKGEHLDLVVDKTEHDFGVAGQEVTRVVEFTYTNKSDKTVEGIKARGECGCNSVKLSHTTLAPGESGTLTVEFHTLFLGGRITKRIYVASKDFRRGRIIIPLKIAIIEGMILGPATVSYGDVLVGQAPTKTFNLKWYEGHGKPFEITQVIVPGFEFFHRIEPYKPVGDSKWGGWTVHLTFRHPPPIGQFSAEVLVRTTDKERARLTLPLSANVCGKIWMQARTLSFGSFDQGTPRTASIKFRPFNKTITFGEVRAKARHGRIEVEVEPDPYHKEKGYWKLSGRVPQETPVGSLDDEVIELHTGVPGEEITLIKVKGTVRAPRKAN